jgi:hypothetical protein
MRMVRSVPPNYSSVALQKRRRIYKKRCACPRAMKAPVISHLKAEHRMGRNYLWFRHGGANNAVLAAAGYNFRRLIHWLGYLLRQILTALMAKPLVNPT